MFIIIIIIITYSHTNKGFCCCSCLCGAGLVVSRCVSFARATFNDCRLRPGLMHPQKHKSSLSGSILARIYLQGKSLQNLQKLNRRTPRWPFLLPYQIQRHLNCLLLMGQKILPEVLWKRKNNGNPRCDFAFEYYVPFSCYWVDLSMFLSDWMRPLGAMSS